MDVVKYFLTINVDLGLIVSSKLIMFLCNLFEERERDASAWERNLLYPLCLLALLALTVSVHSLFCE